MPSPKIEKAVVEREPVAVGVLEQLEKLEAVVERYREQHPPDAAEIHPALAPLTALARELRNEYAKYEARFTPILDRIMALDLDALRNFHGFSEVRPLPRRARDIKRAIAAAIEDIEGALVQMDAFSQGKREHAALGDFGHAAPPGDGPAAAPQRHQIPVRAPGEFPVGPAGAAGG